jgi:uncharacterized PurR-regulated membrane protein YhhQ (DUF165 family)
MTVGAALAMRDVVQRCISFRFGLLAIGIALSALLAPPSLVFASGSAFALGELTDFAVYTPLLRGCLTAAISAASLAGIVVDAIVCRSLTFGSPRVLCGQIVGEAWAVMFAIALVRLLRQVAPTPA